MISYILASQVDLCSISKQFNFSSYHYVQLHVNTRCCWRLQRIFDSNWLKIEWICNNFHSIIQSNTDDMVNFSMQSGSLLISGCAIENLNSFTIHCWYVPVFSSDCIFQSNEEEKTTSHFSWIFFKTSIATDMHIIIRNVWWNRNGFHLNACIAWEKKTSMVSKHLWSISVVHQHLMANKIVKQCWLNSSEDWTVTNTNNNYFKLFMIRNLPNESSPLFSMLNLIVLGIETRLVVALSVFFFFGFSKSA